MWRQVGKIGTRNTLAGKIIKARVCIPPKLLPSVGGEV